MSWHQCHCDLYRIFMEGYSEAAPPLALAHIYPHERARMQQRCLEHAEEIVRVLTDFVNYGRPDDYRHLERDAAGKRPSVSNSQSLNAQSSPPCV